MWSQAVSRIHLAMNKRLIEFAVHSCVVYPKADSLQRSLHEITVPSFDHKEIKIALDQNQSMLMSIYAKGAMEDIEESAKMIEIIKEKAPLQGLRFIQIHKMGIDLLRINLKDEEKNERAAFIEMNEYKRTILELSRDRHSKGLLIFAVGVILFMGYRLHALIDAKFEAQNEKLNHDAEKD